jgi:glycosyltransferase involved in cell wall biosynthesis
MAMGIPVLHGVEGESADLVHRHGMGLPFEPENGAALAEGILALRQDERLRKELAANGCKAARGYERKTLAMAMLATLAAVADRGPVLQAAALRNPSK